LFFAIFYSATPIRAKARPFIDSLFSAGHYTVTAVFGYYLLGGQDINWVYVLAGLSWCIAMHAFSAVPDIDADTKAGLQTIATKLKRRNTILLCMFLYILAGVLVFSVVPVALILSGIYVSILAYCLFEKSEARFFKVYTYFSYINVFSGGAIALSLIYKTL
jgi:4-hydroxybenzoate polyprenyltransferase